MHGALNVKKKNSNSVLSPQRRTVNLSYLLYFCFLSVLITESRLPVYLFASLRLNITLEHCSRNGEFPMSAVLLRCTYMPAVYSRSLIRRDYIVPLQLYFIVVNSRNPLRKLNSQ